MLHPQSHQAHASPSLRFRSGLEVRDAPFGSLLLRVVRAHAALGSELLAEIGLVPPQELVLMLIEDEGPMVQSEIGRRMGRDRSTVTNTLQVMERAELIKRSPAPSDGRALVVSLTARGRRAVAAARRTWAELEEISVDHLTDNDLEGLAASLATVLEGLHGALEDRHPSPG